MANPPDRELVAAVGAGLDAATQSVGELEGVVPGFAYAPTDDVRALKARFWHAFKANPTVDESQVTPALVEAVLGRSVRGYVSHPGFWPWFSNQRVTEALIEMAAERAAETALQMLNPAFPLNDNARVQLIKYVLEFSGRSPPSRKVEKWMDKEVANLDEKELDTLIAKHLAKKLPPTPA